MFWGRIKRNERNHYEEGEEGDWVRRRLQYVNYIETVETGQWQWPQDLFIHNPPEKEQIIARGLARHK